MRIYTDKDGRYVNSIIEQEGIDVEGSLYQMPACPRNVELNFQNGPVSQNGINGLTNELLLAVLIHRTEYLDGKFHCKENQQAINHMKIALAQLEARTASRAERGVEGKEVE